MSYPPTPDPDAPRDPWATPTGDPWPPTYPSQPPPPPPYGQPPFGYPTPAYPPYQRPTNGKAQGALWSGVATLVLSLCCGLGVFGIIPVVLGVLARKEIRASDGHQQGDGMALAGIVTGAIAVVLSLVVIGFLVVVFSQGDGMPGYDDTGV